MRIRIVNRKYLIGGKWFRFEKMMNIQCIGYKFAIGKFEIRLYI
jgi:hypothetical protein